MRNSTFKFTLIALVVGSWSLSLQARQLEPANTIGQPIAGHDAATTTTTVTVTVATTSEPEGVTATLDSLAVNLDEAGSASTLINGTSASEEPAAPSDNETNGDLDGIGIEAKSISSQDPGANGDPAMGAKVAASIDGTEPGAADESATPAKSNRSPSRAANSASGHVNMSHIDKVYTEGHKDEPEIAESWHKMGKKLKKGINNIIGSIVPQALNMSQEAKISSNCSGAMLKWVLSMNQIKSWALRMLDASGKPVAGLLEGSLTMFGNYRQCLKIRAPDDDEIEFAGEFREYFRGKYCIVQAKPWLPEKSRFYSLNSKLKSLMESEDENQWYEKTIFDEMSEWALAFNYINIRMDVCVPSLCSREDIQRVINFLTKGIDLKVRVLRCEMDPPDGVVGPTFVESSATELAVSNGVAASTAEQAVATLSLDSFAQLGWLLVPAIAIALVLLATALSVAIGDKDIDSKSNNKINHTINSLSLKRSVSSHMNVDYGQLADDKPLALYGIRFILVLWVILVESAVNLKFEYLRELLMLKDLIFWWPMQFVINSTIQFDSLILLTAFTMSYKNFLNDGANNFKTITKFVLDKYVRLMPSIMVMVALVILFPLVYRGPVWNDYVARQSAVCQSTGWLNMVFLQNYLPYKEICLPQTWLLCVELQLVLLMAPIVYYLNKYYVNYETMDSSNDLSQQSGRHELMERSKSRSNDPTKLFFWFWTAPGVFLVGSIVLGLTSTFYNVYLKDLPPSWFYTMADPDSKAIYFSEHLMRIWTHLAVFAMGILAGVECRRATRNVIRGRKSSNLGLMSIHSGAGGLSKNHKSHSSSSSSSLPVMSRGGSSSLSSKSQEDMNNSNISVDIHPKSGSHENISSARSGLVSIMSDIIGCLVAVSTMATIIFSTHDWSLNDLPKPLVAGLFDASSRFFWSMAMIWILYMISVPNRDRKFSLLARSLGHPAMVCLGKLSFLVYIIHPFVHTAVLAIQEQPIYSSWLMLFHVLIGNVTITVILASLVSLFVEMPCRNLFRRCGTSLLLTHAVGSNN